MDNRKQIETYIASGKGGALRFIGDFDTAFSLVKSFLEKSGRQKLVFDGNQGDTEDFRQFLKFANLRSDVSGQTIIIKNADKLAEKAFPALLKTLEDFSEGNAFFIFDISDSLPATVASRCITMRFFDDSKDEMSSVVTKNALEEEIDLFVNSTDKLDKFLLTKSWLEKDREEIEVLLLGLSEKLKSQMSKKDLDAGRRLRTVFSALSHIESNVNKKTIFSQLILDW